jgi:dienelactone hydrolase
MATDGRLAYATNSDHPLGNLFNDDIDTPPTPGVYALDLMTGKVVWSNPTPDGICGDRQECFAAHSAAPTAMPGVVFAGSLDGHLRAYSTTDGRILWDFDTAREFSTVNGIPSHGGAIDGPGPVLTQGMLLVNSGYGLFNQMPGNALLAFSVEETAVSHALAQPSNKVESRAVNIYSDGTRLAGRIFFPQARQTGDKLPAILLSHGWGGLKAELDATYAPKFAGGGFVVLTFDYRGWGESDGRLVIKGQVPEPDEHGEAVVKAQVIRELVDPFDQLEDIQAALNFLEGEPGVDRDRIGLWGTSLGGGLVVWTATHDPRVKAVVSQVGAMDGRWAARITEGGQRALHERAIRRARGEIDPVPQGEHAIEGLPGTPYLSKFANYAPVKRTDEINVPTLLIDAELEELFDIKKNSGLVYEKIKDRVVSEYHIIRGISHDGIYSERFEESSGLALSWFNKHLKK